MFVARQAVVGCNMSAEALIAVIAARGGSRGIPRKNLAPLRGKPLQAYTLEHALGTKRISSVVVSTGDDDIAGLAEAYGATVVRRPREISGDFSPSEAAVKHALREVGAGPAASPYLIVMLQSTSPLRRPVDTEEAIAALESNDADSLLSVCPMHGFLWRGVCKDPRPMTYDYRKRPMRQL